MSVYIKGFPLPNNCGACPLRLAWCRERIYMVTRPERCPLIPVPDHRRLIDADVLSEKHKELAYELRGENYDFHMTAKAWVDNAPTIIPAEEGE